MGRKRRVFNPNLFYHIVCRGNRRDPLFKEEQDFVEVLHMLGKIYEITPFELASYCFMTNHFHLQLRSQKESISKVMALLNKRYANYYNTKYNLSGHVFEKRFFSEVISGSLGMLEVGRYILMNPVNAQMVKSPEEYPWSSMTFLFNVYSIPPAFIKTEHLLNCFSGTYEEKRMRLIAYLKA